MNMSFRIPQPAIPFLLLLILTVSGCDALGEGDSHTLPSVSGVIVANGGNFADQNGHLTLFDTATSTTSQLGSMGGFILDIIPDGNEMMVLVNTFGTGRIDVLDTASLSPVSQWTGFESPRGAVRVGDQVWVSTYTWGSPGQVVVLSSTGGIQRVVEVGDVPEGIASWQSDIVVANNGSLGAGTTISRIPVAGGQVSSVETGCDGPRDLVSTSRFLILICSGKTVYSDDYTELLEATPGQVVFFNPDYSVSTRLILPDQARSSNGTRTAYFSEATQELFITLSESDQVAVVDARTNELTQTLRIPAQQGLLGLSGVAYDADRDQLYLGRFPESSAGPFPDFAAAGAIQVYTRNGALISSFTAGASISSILLD